MAWRDTGRTPVLFGVDARAFVPWLILLFYIDWTMLYVAIFTTIIFAILSYVGITLPMMLRWLRASLAGNIRLARPWWRQRTYRND